ncbi:hypothetical protein Psta_3802 [Pirellula staleyi DSM 6068]|uniref:Uncharacterized protein n=1 Tax=Pirellula staleyi (strain ATCC 27377 / DSM 6068 / ICPB 4128) TaxID=530564 RepID=D2R0X2_PIRSD|nr:hypothetical protein [Pirellula staleyi]ADB18457.1 hypothetical protein Psta_3802 [Pirellula staleyi DSM 6068]
MPVRNPRSWPSLFPTGFWGMVMLATLLSLPVFVGCSGCTQTTAKTEDELAEEEKKKKKKAEKPKPNFEMPPAQLLPYDEAIAAQRKVMFVKPGHWIATRQLVKANNFDFAGEIETAAVDRNRNPLDVDHTNYSVSMRTPAVLAKGRAKQVETLYYLPRPENSLSATYNLTSELHAARGSSQPEISGPLASTMKEYEYYFVVLAANPNSYLYLDKLNTIEITQGDTLDTESVTRHYRVLRPKTDRSVPLPSSALTWTSIAYVLWDDIDPAVLTTEQQKAMLDWIHFGGQLIVSGPGSLEKLKGSFLDPYLPADATQSRRLEQSNFDEINAVWSLPTTNKNVKQSPRITILEEKPLLGVELRKRPDADYLASTGEMVIERRVGGGRIVATAFTLTDLRIRAWLNFDGFLNCCLMRRPPRKFSQDEYAMLTANWSVESLPLGLTDPRLVSTIRYFSRDIGHLREAGRPDDTIPSPLSPNNPSVQLPGGTLPLNLPMAGGGMTGAAPTTITPPPNFSNPAFPPVAPPVTAGAAASPELSPPTTRTLQEVDDWHFAGYRAAPQSGVGGWNDFSGAADAARSALRDAAGIKIPQASFVLRVLAVYLLLLVPVNWFVFWIIGRVEWAWAAAPVIAIIGALVVIRMAQLDIGFARNRTEIAILELQGRYERGHLSRYTALYSSLSDTYEIAFDENSAVALPFAIDVNYRRRATVLPTRLHFYSDKQQRLTDFSVQSNSTDVLHSESMHSLQGAITLLGDEAKGFSVRNETELTIRDCGIVRNVAGKLKVAYLSELPSGTTRQLKFVDAKEGATGPAEWKDSYVMSGETADRETDKGTVRLYRLVRLATERMAILPGDMRLVGWTDEAIGGCTIRPTAPQSSSTTLVITHLKRGSLPPAQTDVNIAADYTTFQFEDDENNPQPTADPEIPNTQPPAIPSNGPPSTEAPAINTETKTPDVKSPATPSADAPPAPEKSGEAKSAPDQPKDQPDEQDQENGEKKEGEKPEENTPPTESPSEPTAPAPSSTD